DIQSCNGSDDSCPWRRNPPLTTDDAAAMSKLGTIKVVTSHLGNQVSIKYHDRQLPGARLDAYSPGWLETDGGDINPGRSFTDGENNDAAQVVVINDAMEERLFNAASALGKEIDLDGKPFRVIGVYHSTGNFFENGSKGKAIVPFETARRKLNMSTRWMDLTVRPRDGVAQDLAIDDAISAMRARRGLRPAQVNSFFVSTSEKLLETYNKIVGGFFLVMLVLGSIGLMVGGVGVVAIMMISVTERTREIGVRKAMGATRGIILWQFLVEAATLTTIGAVTGLLAGGGLTWLVRSFTPIAASIPPLAIVSALGVSAFTGMVFGIIPAFRAARLDPVEALRYE
ncbi:MAG: ABC transporter permease, partial [Gemmatimonadota bacterium]|nr:ABC transporter permease [Gemmatimonadota bacterium]